MMEAAFGAKLQYPSLVGSEVFPGKSSSSLRFSGKFGGQRRLQVLVSDRVQIVNGQRSNPLAVSCSYNNYTATTPNYKSPHIAFDEALMLKNKSQEIEPYLSGRCVYLVGMMGSGKTTVGKILSQVLDYSFFDSDTLVEQEVNGKSVSEIFKHHGEGFFRDKETEVLQKLSLMHRFVVSTGGGVVIRPINWKYMQKGVSVWLDVPLEALAERIAAVGTNSRPLLHHESGDAYTKAFNRLSSLFEERGDAYANANARVSLEDIAAKLGHKDVCNLTPTDIAVEALEQIESYLKQEGSMAIAGL